MNDLLDRLSHRPPALLLDRVIRLEGTGAVCGLVAKSEITPAKVLGISWALEAMAQAAGVWLAASNATGGRGMLVQARSFTAQVRYLDLSNAWVVSAEHQPQISGRGLWAFTGSLMPEAEAMPVAEAEFTLWVESE